MTVSPPPRQEGFITSLFRRGEAAENRAPIFSNGGHFEDGSFILTIDLPAHIRFEIEASTNLRVWSRVDEGKSAGNVVSWIDQDAPRHPLRFYRVRAESLRSRNLVGYLSLHLPKGLRMIANPFRQPDPSVASIFPALPEGTSIFKFDPDLFRLGNNPVKNGRWKKPDDTLSPGEGAILFNPGPETQSVVFCGEILERNLQCATLPGFAIYSSLLPMAGRLDHDLGFPFEPGDVVHTFDVASQKYLVHRFGTPEWDDNPPRVAPGESFWAGKSAMNNWIQRIPAD